MTEQTSTQRALREPLQARAVRSRAALVAAGTREFSKRGYAGATSKSIAKAADVSTGTFYQYFADKDALLREIAAERLLKVGASTVGSFDGAGAPPVTAANFLPQVRAQVEQIVKYVIHYHRDDVGLHRVLTERRHVDPELDALTASAEMEAVGTIDELLRRWGFLGDSGATAFVLFGMVEGAVHTHVLGMSVVSDDRFVAALVDAVMRVALATAPRKKKT